MNKSKYLLKNMGILTLSNFSSKVLVFLLVPLYTSVLSTAEYGAYDLGISTVTLLYPILSLNIVDAVMRFSMDKTCNRKSVASIGCHFLLISIAVFGICMYILYVIKVLPDVNGLEVYIFFYYVAYVFNQFLIQLAKGLEKVKEMGFAGIVSTMVTIIVNVIFLLILKWGLSGFFFANTLAQVMSCLYLALHINVWKYIDCRKTDYDLQKEMLLYSIPLIATAVGWWVNSTADKYVVSYMLGVSANGLLSVSYKIPQIINTLQGIFIQAWQISAIKEYGEHDTAKFYGDIFVLTNLLMCICCSWLIILTRPLASILYAKDFYSAWQFVPFLLISSVLNCASGLLGPILSAQKNSKAMMWSAIIGAVTNIIMNIVLVHYIGIQGATSATVICSFLIYIVRKKAVKKDIYIEGYLKILITWGGLCIQGVIESYFKNYYLEFIIMFILLAINIKSLKSLYYTSKTMLLSVNKRKIER